MTRIASGLALLLVWASLMASTRAGPAQKKRLKMNTTTWGKPVGGLRLGLSAARENIVRIHLENVGDKPLELLSHVESREKHLDWYTLRIEDEKGSARTLQLLDSRRESNTVRVRVEPGAGIQHDVDVAAWATRPVNGSKPLAAGTYKTHAVYEVKSDKTAWTGRVEAGPIALQVTPKELR